MDDLRPVEEKWDEELLESASGAGVGIGEAEFDAIPETFTGTGQWPHYCNLHCLVCGHTFQGRPVPIPKYVSESCDYDPHRRDSCQQITVKVHSVACTFNCAMRYLTVHAAPETKVHMQELLSVLYFAFTGRTVRHIEMPPDPVLLRRHGGPMSSAEYLKRLSDMDKQNGLPNYDAQVVPDRERTH
ncbi:MAG: hypothetical protein P1U53_15600 [Sulfitobacter sp.]|nr:hypothetical protein [Sulfitobacter sp.]